MSTPNVKEIIREKYGKAALRFQSGVETPCCRKRVLAEAFRVLKPGGRFAVSDVVVRGHVPSEIKKNIELWAGCVAGALSDHEYLAKLTKAGFDNIEIEPTRVYSVEDARAFLSI